MSNHEISKIDKVFRKITIHKKKLNQKNIGTVLAVVIGIIISVIVVFTQINEQEEKVIQPASIEGWIGSGPFKINKQEYKLGEQVFLSVDGLKPLESGNIIVLTPNSVQFQKIPFDGGKKAYFNQYFKPVTSRLLKICGIDDLVGEWTIIFQGVTYEQLNFKLLNEFIPGDEENYQSIC